MEYTKEELLAYIQREMELKLVGEISTISLIKMADMLNIEVTAVRSK
jgi:hypothetical protein